MFEGLKLLLSKKLGVYSEYDIINHNIKNYKVRNDDLKHFIDVCNMVLNNLNSICEFLEEKIENREIDNDDLFILKYEIERRKSSVNSDINEIVLLENKLRILLQKTVSLYFTKLKTGEYNDNKLKNMYFDFVNSTNILLYNIVFKKEFNNEAFFTEMLKKLIDKDVSCTMDDIDFVLEKINYFKNIIYRQLSLNVSNISQLEMSEKKQKYDTLDRMYSNKRR